MRLIIPGAAGFVGTNFCNSLSQDEIDKFDEIVLVDLLQYGQNNKLSHKLLEQEKVVFIEGSIYDHNILSRIIKENDVILHLAVEENTFDTPQEKSTVGILEYFDFLVSKKIQKFIFLSTADVYGVNNSSDITESDITKPTILYAANKISMESYLQAYTSLYNFPAVIFRPVTIFGPYQQPGWLVPRIITRVLKNEKIQITGDGSVKRDWIYVADVVTLLKKIISYTQKDLSGEVFNIGTGTEETVLEVTSFILDYLTRSKELIEFIPDRAGDIPRQVTKATKARKTFNWLPKVDFYSGLEMTIEWYKQANEE